METNAKNIIPAVATHPGTILKKELKARGIRQKDFAAAIGMPAPNLSELIKGKRNVTEAIAIKLEDALGIPFQNWMNLQNRYYYTINCGSAAEQKYVEELRPYTLDQFKDEFVGPVGTQKRDLFDARLEADIKAYRVGEAIRAARRQRQLTQEQLGERIGVKKSQISRMERGQNLTISSLSRVFSALGVTSGALVLDGVNSVVLW